MSEHPVPLTTSGPPRTVLAPEPAAVLQELARLDGLPSAQRRAAAAAVVAANPRSLFGWCAVGDAATDPVERYAAYRVGYHRGLDALRAGGWRGSGYVRWAEEPNRGFLGCLRGLRDMAAAIGEADEVVRIGLFLAQLDPGAGGG